MFGPLYAPVPVPRLRGSADTTRWSALTQADVLLNLTALEHV